MRVLLIWNEVPESVKFFAIQDPTSKELDTLYEANGHYLNLVGDEEFEPALNRINAALTDDPRGFDEQDIPWVGRWVTNEIPVSDMPNAGAFDQIFIAGFLL
jgi:hypothetical protein